MSESEHFLVTGCMGCLGAWATRVLFDQGTQVTGFDLSENDARLRLTMGADRARVDTVRGDLSDAQQVAAVIRDRGITHVVHLAALQIPFCRADPVRGSQVNVTGTVNVFEAVRASEGRVRGLSFASSGAVFGPAALYELPLRDDSPPAPTTLYGAYKQANEWTARIYAQDWQVGSVCLRPFIVYGAGRDQGMTSTPTVAMLEAAAGREYTINFGGRVLYQLAEDAARAFVEAARRSDESARAFNLGGTAAAMDEVVEAIVGAVPEAVGRVGYQGAGLPFPADVDSGALDAFLGGFRYTPLRAGVASTVETFRRGLGEGLLA